MDVDKEDGTFLEDIVLRLEARPDARARPPARSRVSDALINKVEFDSKEIRNYRYRPRGSLSTRQWRAYEYIGIFVLLSHWIFAISLSSFLILYHFLL